jgi:type I restriction enzyme S subunit
VKPGTILIPSHGTLGERELYCRALIVSPRTSQYVFSGDFFRCAPLPGRIRPGFLYAFLRSRTAFRLLRSISIGSKQQAFHPELLQQLSVPRLQKQRESAIADKVDRAVLLYDRALDCGDQARELVERSLDSGI